MPPPAADRPSRGTAAAMRAGSRLRAALRTRTRARGRAGLAVTRLHRSGGAPARVLLIGDRADCWPAAVPGGPSLPEQLADGVQGIVGTGVDLDVLSELSPVLDAVRRAFDRWRLWRYDAVVILLGDGATRLGALLPMRHLQRLLDDVAHDTGGSVEVVVAGPAAALRRRRVTGGTLGSGGAGGRIRTLRLPRSEPDPGAHLAEALREPLERMRDGVRAAADEDAAMRQRGRVLEDERQQSLDDLHLLDTRPTARLTQVVEMARTAFDVESAELNLIDRGRQFTLAATGEHGISKARDGAFCDETVRLPGATVVLDTRTDPRFSSLPAAQGARPVRFYAAYPVESPTGYRVGTLCIWDRAPRGSADLDLALLRDLALLAEAELIDPR